MVPLERGEMKGLGLHGGKITQGITSKSQFREQEKRIQRSEASLPDGV